MCISANLRSDVLSTGVAGSKKISKPFDDSNALGEDKVQCHCGNVSARIRCDKRKLTVWDCDCSDCYMRGNIHFVLPCTQITIDDPAAWHMATTLYLWGTKVAERRFCKTCGILPWYRPRSNPDGVAVTLACVQFGDNPPHIETKTFDGRFWEESIKTSTIASESQLPK